MSQTRSQELIGGGIQINETIGRFKANPGLPDQTGKYMYRVYVDGAPSRMPGFVNFAGLQMPHSWPGTTPVPSQMNFSAAVTSTRTAAASAKMR